MVPVPESQQLAGLELVLELEQLASLPDHQAFEAAPPSAEAGLAQSLELLCRQQLAL